MQVEVEIAFDKLVQITKNLPAKQWKILKAEVESTTGVSTERENLKELLLNGPTFSKKQLEAIAETRNELNKWRSK